MKKPIKKLTLNKTTISKLDASLMNQRVGGGKTTRSQETRATCLCGPTTICAPTPGCSDNCMSNYPYVCPDTV